MLILYQLYCKALCSEKSDEYALNYLSRILVCLTYSDLLFIIKIA